VIRTELTVPNKSGFHLRAATLVAKAALKRKAKMTLAKGAAVADCKSPLELVTLMAPQGSKLALVVDGEDERDATDEIVEIFRVKFYEDEFAPKN